MKKILILCLLLGAFSAEALELEYLNQVTLTHKMKFKKSVIGGLSGLFYDPTTQVLSAISDDRGNVNEPRFYQFQVSADLKKFKVEPQSVVFLSVNQSELSHKSTRSKSKLFSRVLDLEGISMTPWGDFLLVNEGDMNQKPRVNPQVLDVKPDGTIVREFEVPSDFLPEPTGEQKKGVQNNLAFEGITANPNGKEWLVSTEAPLKQDPKDFVRFIQYTMPEAWVLKPQKEFHYPFVAESSDPKSLMQFQKGISEIQFIDESRLLVIERAVRLSSQGLEFSVQVFETDLRSADKGQTLSRKLVLDFATLTPKIGKIDNFEGMTLGPKLSDGRRTLILVSDDNFVREQKTQFLLFAIKE